LFLSLTMTPALLGLILTLLEIDRLTIYFRHL
jgi:hypothetical protein